MNNSEKICIIAKAYKNICVNINEFVDLLSLDLSSFQPITMRDVLATGLYAYIENCSIWCSKMITPGTVRISNNIIENVAMRDADMSVWQDTIDLANDVAWNEWFEKLAIIS